MDFRTLLKSRRSVRAFQNRDIPTPVVEEILRDACWAPSASDGQPCRFVVVGDRTLLKRLSDDSKRNLLADLAVRGTSPLRQYEELLGDETFNVFYNAPCCVFVTGPRDLATLDVDAALTAAYLMFSAADRGLGTCWIGLGADIRERGLLRAMGLTDADRIVAPIIVGYPVHVPEPSERHAPAIVRIV